MSGADCNGFVLDPCLPDGKTSRQIQEKYDQKIDHEKHVDSSITVGLIKIPLRIRDRFFSLAASQGVKKENYQIVSTVDGVEADCFDSKSLYSISVSENSVAIDGTVYILDTEHSNAFWREVTSVCNFSGSSTDTVTFHHPVSVSNKISFDVVFNVTYIWKLMINGVVETVYTETAQEDLGRVFFVYGVPEAGQPDDIDFKIKEEGGNGYTFLYWTNDEEEPSGGRDYYYPRYLWSQGIYRDQDSYDAVERYWDGFGGTFLRNTAIRTLSMPQILGAEDPRGSIIRDAEGNTFASVTVTKGDGSLLHINRLTDKNGNAAVIPDTVQGEDIRYYPVGLI